MSNPISLPARKRAKEDVLATMRTARQDDIGWQEGKVFSLVYHAGEEASALLKEAYTMFMSENGLNPTAFPSLKKFESEVVSISANLLGGDDAVAGNMTSGGTESILMAVYTAREWARANFPADHPKCTRPEIVAPLSVHPAFEKAAHYFGITVVHVPLGGDFRADVGGMRAAVTNATIMMVGSAPAYPHGLVDPIGEMAAVAQEAGILFHVDACVGGFILPFVRRLGYEVPDFDFRVPGVTSISADLHKYAYAAKGASVILYRNKELRRHQLYAYMDWPGGIYASPTMSGTRPGGAIAAAWAILNFMGEEGYLEIAQKVMETAVTLQNGIAEIDGVAVVGRPQATIFALISDQLNIYDVGDEMQAQGWHLDRQQFPATLHVTLNQAHIGKAQAFLDDLRAAVETVKRPSAQRWLERLVVRFSGWLAKVLPARWLSWLTGKAAGSMTGGGGLPERSAAMYGMLGSLPNRDDLEEVVLDLVEGFTEVEQ